LQTGPQRQQIRDQLGVLEERLEELGALARAGERGSEGQQGYRFGAELLLNDALESMRDLSLLVNDQQQQKSVSAQDFLLRICALMVQSAQAHGVDIAVSHHGDGRISLEMAELVMGAIIAAFRSSLAGYRNFTPAERVKSHLFRTASVYLEVKATPGELQFRLLDDGQGLAAREQASFRRLREHVAECGGWFAHKNFEPCGGLIEFKIPIAQNRVEAIVLRQGEFEMLLPSSCVLEMSRASGQHPVAAGVATYEVHGTDGLVKGSSGSPVLVRVGVADMQFWIGCDEATGPVKVRRSPAADFFEEGCWIRTLGVFQHQGAGRALPMLDGAALVQFQTILGGEV
jgi:hypothetical protein